MTAAPYQADTDASPSLRAAILIRDAKALAESNTRDFAAALEDLIERAREISQGGDVYAPGVREICETFSEMAASRARAVAMARQSAPPARPARFTPEPTFLLCKEARLTPNPAIIERLAEVGRR